MKIDLRALGLALASVCMLAGCVDDQYRVRVEPTDDGLERSIEITPGKPGLGALPGGINVGDDEDASSRIDDSELESLAKLYGAHEPSLTYSSMFGDRVPPDVQGDGFLSRMESSLGEIAAYIERPRGERDIVKSLERLTSAQDLFIEVAIEDLGNRFAGEPWLPALLEWIEDVVSHEFRAVGLEIWALRAGWRNGSVDEFVDPDDAEELDLDDWRTISVATMLGRMALRQVEAGRIQPHELSRLASAILSADDDVFPDLAAGELPGWLVDVIGEEGVRRLLEESEEGDLYEDEHPKVLEWESRWDGDLLSAALGVDGMFEDFDAVSIELVIGAEPLITNGKWDAQAGSISWEFHVPTEPSSTAWTAPTALAIWATPNPETQRAIFGHDAIVGRELAELVLWINGLEETDRSDWDALIHTLQATPASDRERIMQEAAENPGLTDGVDMIEEAWDD